MNKRIAMLFVIPPLMFGFGYLMVPIYNVFCDLTGLNGKTGEIAAAEAARIEPDASRLITVEFMANRNQDIALDFAPSQRTVSAHPGQRYRAVYRARNRLERAMVGQATPSVSPSRAARYFNKVECFCFGRQPFAAGEARDLPLEFVIDPDLPRDIDTITLSYTFFEIDAPDAGEDAHDHATHDHAAHDHATDADAARTETL
ncbi:MAG: cytochrome c oxidase assembly protein [bacterium]